MPAVRLQRRKSSESRCRGLEFLHADPVREQVSNDLLLFILIHPLTVLL